MSGAGDNGKTVLIRTVMRLLGHDLVHAQRVEDLDKSRFAIGSLFGKYLFVDDDVRAGARLPDGMLKTISEAKEVTGELKYQAVVQLCGPHRARSCCATTSPRSPTCPMACGGG